MPKAAEAGTPSSAELAEKYVQEPRVKPGGMRVLFASVFSTMFGNAWDVRGENRPTLHPPPLLLEWRRRGNRVLGTLVDGTWNVPTTLENRGYRPMARWVEKQLRMCLAN